METMDFDHVLFEAALGNAAHRPRSLANMTAVLATPGCRTRTPAHRWSSTARACATHGWLDAVQWLVASVGVQIATDSVVQAAAAHGHLPVVKCLLAANRDIDIDSALHAATFDNHPSITQYLLAHGADLHAGDDQALRTAAQGGATAVIGILLAAGADVHARDDEALLLAAMEGHLPIVERLLAAGADVHARNERALCAATQYGHQSVVEHLLAHSADAHARNEQPLTVALAQANMGIASLLLHSGSAVIPAWDQLNEQQKRCAVRLLDTMAADIPDNQRRDVIALSPHRFPALKSLAAAERRRTAHRPPGSQRGTEGSCPINMPR